MATAVLRIGRHANGILACLKVVEHADSALVSAVVLGAFQALRALGLRSTRVLDAGAMTDRSVGFLPPLPRRQEPRRSAEQPPSHAIATRTGMPRRIGGQSRRRTSVPTNPVPPPAWYATDHHPCREKTPLERICPLSRKLRSRMSEASGDLSSRPPRTDRHLTGTPARATARYSSPDSPLASSCRRSRWSRQPRSAVAGWSPLPGSRTSSGPPSRFVARRRTLARSQFAAHANADHTRKP